MKSQRLHQLAGPLVSERHGPDPRACKSAANANRFAKAACVAPTVTFEITIVELGETRTRRLSGAIALSMLTMFATAPVIADDLNVDGKLSAKSAVVSSVLSVGPGAPSSSFHANEANLRVLGNSYTSGDHSVDGQLFVDRANAKTGIVVGTRPASGSIPGGIGDGNAVVVWGNSLIAGDHAVAGKLSVSGTVDAKVGITVGTPPPRPAGGPIPASGSIPTGVLDDSMVRVWGNSRLNGNQVVTGNQTISGSQAIAGNQATTGKLSFGATTRQMVNLWNDTYGIGVQDFGFYMRTGDSFFWYVGGGESSANGDAGRDAAGNAGTKLMALGNTGQLSVSGMVITPTLQITGGSDVAEPFVLSSPGVAKGAVVVIDENNPGELKLSDRAYDRRVAGIVSGANNVRTGIAISQQGLSDGGQNVALNGRVYVLADATSSPIKPGDLLTTSDKPGYAMKVTDYPRAQGAIIGKAMGALPGGNGLILVLVTLQ